jgi:hypothetical protein
MIIAALKQGNTKWAHFSIKYLLPDICRFRYLKGININLIKGLDFGYKNNLNTKVPKQM